MPKFENGEVAILCGLKDKWSVFNGEEVSIVKCIGMFQYKEGEEDCTYIVEAPFLVYKIPVVAEQKLKKKKPPEDDIDWVEKLKLKNINKEGKEKCY